METTLKSIYIHIPFCKSKCHYCNFVSFAGKDSCIKDYFSALRQEITFNLKKYPDNKFKTLYIGGGTPSIIPVEYYEPILSGIHLADNAEITIEVNPGTVSESYLKNLHDLGFNRLSIGVQSFNDDILKAINRQHSSKDAVKTAEDARKADFENISIDLIYGLPEQTHEIWEQDVTQAVNLEINHVSTYGLKIEEGTYFAQNIPDNLPDEEAASNMYLKTIEILSKNGFEHYEISNFAKKERKSQHNLTYWENNEYFGVGLAAHGYVDGIRYSNKQNLAEYIKNPLEKENENKLSRQEIIEEAIFLGLRLRKGLNLNNFQERYSINLMEKYKSIIEKYTNQGLMVFNSKELKLTTQGILLSNSILAEFLE